MATDMVAHVYDIVDAEQNNSNVSLHFPVLSLSISNLEQTQGVDSCYSCNPPAHAINMTDPVMLLLLLMLLATPLRSYAYHVHCSFSYGSLSASDARAAANLIPASWDPHGTAQGYALDSASRDVSYPIIFHSGNAAIAIHQSHFVGNQERLFPSEQVVYLWPLAKQVASQIIQQCVDRGTGGRAQFEVDILSQETRIFGLVVRRMPINFQQNPLYRGYQVSPA